jgi:hypothetical protein
MARTKNVVIENNFKGGYVTEATGLNFPENACTEQDNCIFDEKGRVYRRFGFDYESNASLAAIDTSDVTIRGFTWNNVGNIGTTAFRVMQIGDTLHFWQVSSSASVSTQKMSDTINLGTFLSDPAVDVTINACVFTATNKYLIVTHPQLEPFFVYYDPSDQSFHATEIDIQIRDFAGLDDGYAIDFRPTASVGSLTTEHKYNLFNQGWYFNSNAALTTWDAARADMPSNADIWWQFKDTSDVFATAQIPLRDLGNTLAPKGHYILSLHNQDRTTASGVPDITTISTGSQRVSTCAFFTGRVFYSGLNSSGYGNQIYFTQIIEREEQFGFCYQSNDPTSEVAFDLLPSDGGVITIFEVENIIKMIPTQSALFVFATNGIWAISGSTGLGFTATDYSITKVATNPSISDNSFIIVDNLPIWWNTEGIFALSQGQQQQQGISVQSLTDRTIRTDFRTIPTRSKLFACGAYDSSTKTARWVFRRAESSGTGEDYAFDSVLSINFLTGAFYTWSIPEGATVNDCFSLVTVGGSSSLTEVVDNADAQVLDEASDLIYVSSLDTLVVSPVFKYFITVSTNVTFAETNDEDYLDWLSVDDVGVDYTSYFVTGYRLDGQTQNFFQSNYVFVFLEQETNASCFMNGIFDWTTSGDSGKWSTTQQIYNSTLTNRAVNFRRLKVRGKGRSLQLKFTSEAGKPFTIIGWSIMETANASV